MIKYFFDANDNEVEYSERSITNINIWHPWPYSQIDSLHEVVTTIDFFCPISAH